MTSEDSQLFHLGLLPDYYLVLGVSVRRDELVDVLRVDQIANLTSSVDPVHWLQGQGVPEPDTTISSSTTTAHGTVLMRRPRYGLYCRYVLAEFGLGLRVVALAPYHQFIVVASGG